MPQQDAACHGGIEALGPVGHGDLHRLAAGIDGRVGQTPALAADDDAEPPRKLPAHRIQRHGAPQGGGRERPSVVSDAFEAVIAALYLDGGLETARNFILPFLTEGKTAEEDYKTKLQEVIQQNPEEKLHYEVESESGPDHDKRFGVAVYLNSNCIARGEGRSKKSAEQHAAREALRLMGLIHKT